MHRGESDSQCQLSSIHHGSLFLLQQPEVHVHPSAQAAVINIVTYQT